MREGVREGSKGWKYRQERRNCVEWGWGFLWRSEERALYP